MSVYHLYQQIISSGLHTYNKYLTRKYLAYKGFLLRTWEGEMYEDFTKDLKIEGLD